MLLNRVIFQKQSDRLLFNASLSNTVLRILFFYCFPAVCLFVSSIAATTGRPTARSGHQATGRAYNPKMLLSSLRGRSETSIVSLRPGSRRNR